MIQHLKSGMKDLVKPVNRSLAGNAAHGFRSAADGQLLDLPLLALELAHAERGESPSIIASKVFEYATFPIANAASTAALGLLLPEIAAGAVPLLALGVSAIVVGVAASQVRSGIRSFSKLDRKVTHLEMGGSYQDSETAYNLRMRSISEMNGTLQPSRRYLGSEALLMHT